MGRIYDALVEQRGVLTRERCADLLGVSPKTVDKYVLERGLPCHRFQNNQPPRFLLDELVQWVRSQNTKEREVSQ